MWFSSRVAFRAGGRASGVRAAKRLFGGMAAALAMLLALGAATQAAADPVRYTITTTSPSFNGGPNSPRKFIDGSFYYDSATGTVSRVNLTLRYDDGQTFALTTAQLVPSGPPNFGPEFLYFCQAQGCTGNTNEHVTWVFPRAGSQLNTGQRFLAPSRCDTPACTTRIVDLSATVVIAESPAPAVDGLAPTSGSASGGTSVVITGRDLSTATAVTFGGTPASFVVDGDTRITATAPAHGAGVVDVIVTGIGGASDAAGSANDFTYLSNDAALSALTISAGAPTPAFTAGQTTYALTVPANVSNLTVTPTAAVGAQVRVNGTPVASGSSSTPILLAEGANTVTIVVTAADAQTIRTYTLTITRSPLPVVRSLAPAQGRRAGGASVVLTGDGLGDVTAVAFGAVPAASFRVDGPSQITAVTPPLSTGVSEVTVTSFAGVSPIAGPGNDFVVVAPAQVSLSNVPARVASGRSLTLTYALSNPNGVGTLTGVQHQIDLPAGLVLADDPEAPATACGGTLNAVGGASSVTLQGGSLSPSGVCLYSFAIRSTAGGTYALPTGVLRADVVEDVASRTAASVEFSGVAAPVAAASTASVAFGSTGAPLPLSLSGGAAASLSITNPPAHGTAVVSGLSIIYTPAAGYFGADAVTYTATNAGGTSAPAVVSITVAAPVAPTVTPVSATVAYNSTGQAIPLSVSGSSTGLVIVTPPSHGTAVISGTSAIYVPTSGYSGVDQFAYAADGPGGRSVPATVSVTVSPPAPPVVPPAPQPPVAPRSDGAYVIDLGGTSGGAITGFQVGRAPRNVQATIDVVPGPSGDPLAQTFRLRYVPNTGFMGIDTVDLIAAGPGGTSAPVTYTVNVAGRAPNLQAQVASGSVVRLRPTDRLVGGPFTGLRIVSPPAFGSASVEGMELVYAPGSASGATSFDYVIELPFGASASGRVDLVAAPLPTVSPKSTTTLQGVPVTVRLTDGAVGGPFVSAAVVSVTPVDGVRAQVVAAGSGIYDLTITPVDAFSGQAVISYSLSNAVGSATGTVTVTVQARPDPSQDPTVRALSASQVQAAGRFADGQVGNVQQRLSQLRTGDNRSQNSVRLAFLPGQDRRPGEEFGGAARLTRGDVGAERDEDLRRVLPVSTGAVELPVGPAMTAAAADGPSGIGVWTSGQIEWGRVAADGRRDDRFTSQGLTLGVDMKLADGLIAGVAVGYGEDRTRLGDDESRSNSEAVSGVVYASWAGQGAFYLDGMLGRVGLDFESRRQTAGLGGAPAAIASGERSGSLTFATAAVGRQVRGSGFLGDVYARLDARALRLDAFTETGAGLAALSWDELDQDGLASTLGASASWVVAPAAGGRFEPHVRLEWSHQFVSPAEQTLRYADWTASPDYLLPTDGWSRDVLRLGLGAEWFVSDSLRLRLGYRGAVGDGGEGHGLDLGVSFGW